MPRHGWLIVAVAVATTIPASGCGGTVVRPAEIAQGIQQAGLQLEPASPLDAPQVTREQARLVAGEVFTANGWGGRITAITLVTISGPGNDRLGWDPRQHRLGYAIDWTDGSTVGFTLVSAVTGEVLLVTGYD